ncbi:hypothetical protein CUMW_264880 [Citrus unshiu]|uniref:Uncharacterized protein n=1 Tax=Citrus unshiu TaxID=55188 RepID=A0A2H5QV86_CITUN|nr:hypothetical protein CUMW_264880 [Citrus unshiu]
MLISSITKILGMLCHTSHFNHYGGSKMLILSKEYILGTPSITVTFPNYPLRQRMKFQAFKCQKYTANPRVWENVHRYKEIKSQSLLFAKERYTVS